MILCRRTVWKLGFETRVLSQPRSTNEILVEKRSMFFLFILQLYPAFIPTPTQRQISLVEKAMELNGVVVNELKIKEPEGPTKKPSVISSPKPKE